MFGESKEMSKILLSAGREKNISESFGINVNFSYPQSVCEFNMDLTFFQRKRKTDDIITMGEKKYI